jgi:hypothetical protein
MKPFRTQRRANVVIDALYAWATFPNIDFESPVPALDSLVAKMGEAFTWFSPARRINSLKALAINCGPLLV